MQAFYIFSKYIITIACILNISISHAQDLSYSKNLSDFNAKKQQHLTADTPLETINSYQKFFTNKENMTQIQMASPKTLYMWQNMSRVLYTEMILRNGLISLLPTMINPAIENITFEQKDIGKFSVEEFFNQKPLDAMIIIHRGNIVCEKYKTMRPFDKHNWFSTGKVVSSTIIALLEEQGKINILKPVSTYLPELQGSVWDSVPVQDVLNMATGLNSTEHEEPGDDARINPKRGWFQWATAMGIFPLQNNMKKESPIDVLRRMQRVKKGNTAFEYNSINTWVLELIVEKVTNRPINEVFGNLVWRKIGAKADGFIGITPDGYPMAWGFVSSTLEDLGRFGMIFTPSWKKISKEQIISTSIINKIRKNANPAIYGNGSVGKDMLYTLGEKNLGNSYQWDIVFPDGDFFKGGVGGQGLYVSETRDLVIAWFSTGENNEHVMARAIALSNLFQSRSLKD